ncbi:MAG: AsmA family protein [Salaquimonas sp.]|nr:AsmA family protein [Salaquimonas sp.]
MGQPANGRPDIGYSDNGRNRMKRLIALALVLAAIIAGAAALLPFLVSSESVRERIIEQAETLTGRRMSFRAAPKIFFNPYLGIAIDSVIFEGQKRRPEDPPLVEMEELRGRVAILPALFGRVVVTQYQFVRPRFNLKVFADGHLSWQFPDGKVWQLLEQARARRQATETNAKVDLSDITRVKIGQFEIVDGTINYEDEQNGAKETVTNVNATLNWPDSASAWTVAGSAIWRDEALEFSVRTTQPLLMMAGGTSAASAAIKSGAFQFSFDGDANMLASLHLSGTATLSAPSIPRLVNLLGGKMEVGSTPGQFSASGTINGTPRQVELTEADVTIDGNKGRGVVQFARGERNQPQFNATLAFKSFDFTPYLATLRQEAEINRPELAGLNLIDRFDSDIRLSAGQANLGALALTEFAGALSLRNGELVFDLGNGTVAGGTATGSFSAKKTESGFDFGGEANLSGVKLSGLLDSLYPDGIVRVNANGDIKLSARSTGKSAREVIEALRGWVSLKAGEGTLTGVDAGALLTAADKQEDDSGVLELSGATSFDTLGGDVIFNRGAVWIKSFDLVNKKLHAKLTGRADLVSGGLALRVRLAKAGTETASPETYLFVGGVASSPLVTRDQRAAGPADGQ